MDLSQQLLTSLGLNQSEIKVYLAALELGEASVQDLSRKSGVKRTSIYNFLDHLKQLQVLTETKKGKRSSYSAVHPEQLFESLKMRVHEFNRALPALTAIYNKSRKKPSVTFYEGVEGIKDVYSDAMREGKAINAWTDWENMLPVMGAFLEDYPKERARRGITFYQITRDTPVARKVGKRDNQEARMTKYLKAAEFNTEIMIYGDKVAIMSFKSHSPFGLIIEDAGTAQTLLVSWHELWKRL